jgi:phosphopantothenoylcysteine decarboxylase/phosphopantothenate--cysteine ligase
MWEGEVVEGAAIEHIRMAQEADVLVIAPATANFLAKMAGGIADDLLSTIYLATKARVVVAPAMNVAMWEHVATRANLDVLRKRGVEVAEPGSGYLACGMVGDGRLADVGAIADAVCVAPVKDLVGERILITAGGTREPIDAVRFLGNRSSGKMGVALAAAAMARGAEVILVTAAGASGLGCEEILVDTAAEMQGAVVQHLRWASVVVMAAAVADYRVVEPAVGKMKKQASMTLDLVENPDILREVVRLRGSETVVIGFAAETERVVEEGRRKLREKGVDAIVANDVSGSESGIGAEVNAGVFLTNDGEWELGLSSKRVMAERILDRVVGLRVRAAV